MPSGSLLALLDDIVSVLDDVAMMTKVAAKKSAGVLGDDLALNAEQVAGVRASRELPVVWAVAKGSLWNKAILVPLALLISALLPQLITPLLVVGGLYLCFEGVEKIAHRWLHPAKDAGVPDAEEAPPLEAEEGAEAGTPEALERQKIAGAIRTDFVLSAELVVIALGTVAEATWLVRLGVLCGIALAMTAGVYGFVAIIVKLDDVGLYLARASTSGLARAVGRGLLTSMPWLMRALSVVGTAAMFLVGGGILSHAFPALHQPVEQLVPESEVRWLVATLVDLLAGIVAGAVVLAAVQLALRMRALARPAA